ncbi:MAG: hypothetical protein UU61_C0006G0005 [Parcubacteria group bacterium GW2011_GWB1_41_4]|nr:MAG: hypothetical protein UU61_C0006G0005 [Parcubacteria group bacterium GW2011_GWB1_41_4]
MVFEEKYFSRFLSISGISREALALYSMHFLRNFAVGLFGIFVPIYIFQNATKPVIVSDIFLSNLLWVVFYFLAYSFSMLISSLFLGNLIFNSLGFKRSIFLSILLLIFGILFLVFSEKVFLWSFLSAFLLGACVNFYWIPFHVFFIRKANQGGNYGKETSFQIFLGNLAGIVAPFIAGVVIYFSGFEKVFTISIAFLLVSLLPLFFFVSEGLHRNHDLKKIVSGFLKDRSSRRALIGLAGAGVEDTLFGVFWPILLFLTLMDTIKIGAITTISTFLSMVVVLWAGMIFEGGKNKKLFEWSAIFNSLLYLPRFFINFASGIYVLDILDKLNSKIYGVGLSSSTYDLAKRFGDSDFILIREVVLHLGRVLALLASLVLLLFFPWRTIFFLIGAISLLNLLVLKEHSA